MIEIIQAEKRLQELHHDIKEKEEEYAAIANRCYSQHTPMKDMIAEMIKKGSKRGYNHTEKELRGLRDALCSNQDAIRELVVCRSALYLARHEQDIVAEKINKKKMEILTPLRKQAEQFIQSQKKPRMEQVFADKSC